MIGRIVAGLVVIGLAVGVWAVWPREDPGPATSSTVATSTPSTTTAETTTTTVDSTTTTTPTEADIIDTVEEAEAILTELWFGWFEGIYNQDVDRIKEVVASQLLLDNAATQFGVMEFGTEPTQSAITISQTELVRFDPDCSAIWANTLFPFRGGDTEGLHVLRVFEGEWRFVNVWVNKNDLWEQDCEAQLEPLQ